MKKLSEANKFRKEFKKKASICITITPPSGFFDVFLFKSKKEFGHLSTTCSTEKLIEESIYAFLHTINDEFGFNPVIRSCNEKDKVIIVVFKFNRKYVQIIRQFCTSIAKIYNSKLTIRNIDYEKYYSHVMTHRKLKK